MTGKLEEKLIVKKLKSEFAGSIIKITDFRGDLAITVEPSSIVDICKFLKADPDLDFNMLLDVSGVDYLYMDSPDRFAVVYHLYSLEKKHRVRLKAFLDSDNPEIESVYQVWKASKWFEREAYDLFGIRFMNHPGLKRILTHNDFKGHPLRKDYDANQRHPQVGRRK